MAAKLLHVEFARPRSVEDLLRQVMVECRRRSGLGPREFALAINNASPRSPGLMDASVEAFEAGHAIPGADVLCRAMILSGQDVVGRLGAWVNDPSASSPPPRPSVSPRHASGRR